MTDTRDGQPAALIDHDIGEFREVVVEYYRRHGRRMPWRETVDPYAILVSEVMLQQTQVRRVEPKYLSFMKVFPTIEALAAAPLALVLESWSGLGYNRRAVRLKRLAERVVTDHGGVVPSDPSSLAALPGIGSATARAIVTYAFGSFAPFIETNVRTVFLHHFFADATDVPDAVVMPLVEQTWDREDPRGWAWALMDYGAHLKASMPNPSRRSRHHARQGPFPGSDRQARGALLRAVMAEGTATAGALSRAAGVDLARAERLLGDLEREGFLGRKGSSFSVAD